VSPTRMFGTASVIAGRQVCRLPARA
jgi:hypothetical protein